MDQVCGVDDGGQGIPLSITSCDANAVSAYYYGNYSDCCGLGGTSCGGGGGGGGGCIDVGGECDPDDNECCDTDCVDYICQDVEPIIFDLTGHGYELTNAANGVTFDFFADGKPIQMSWTAAGWNGGFLALDRNGNGKIDDGSELFGNVTPQPAARGKGNGFLALAVYDLPANGGDGNGRIDAHDAIYSKLLVWVNRNHDGISQPDELLTLQQAGIESISLNYSLSTWADAYGNVFRYRAEFTSKIPGNPWVYDVIFKTASQASAPTAATKPQ